VYNAADMQTEVTLRVFQGESRLVKDNIFLGDLDIPIPPRPAGEVELDVRFTYDINGLLEASVSIPSTGENYSLVIENSPGAMTPEEIATRLVALESLKIHPREEQVNTVLLARLERFYQESLGETRQYVGQLTQQFQLLLETQDERQIRAGRSDVSKRLEELESGFHGL
jgi:molecular chaperone HscC